MKGMIRRWLIFWPTYWTDGKNAYKQWKPDLWVAVGMKDDNCGCIRKRFRAYVQQNSSDRCGEYYELLNDGIGQPTVKEFVYRRRSFNFKLYGKKGTECCTPEEELSALTDPRWGAWMCDHMRKSKYASDYKPINETYANRYLHIPRERLTDAEDAVCPV